MLNEILDNGQLAERWRLAGTVDAIAKRFQRLRALPKSNPRHLKAFRIGNQTRYRMADILEYESRNANNFARSAGVGGKRNLLGNKLFVASEQHETGSGLLRLGESVQMLNSF